MAVWSLRLAVEIIQCTPLFPCDCFTVYVAHCSVVPLTVCLRTSSSDLNSDAEFSPLFYPSEGEAVFARCLSSLKDERVQASKLLHGPKTKQFSGNKESFLEDIRKVRHCACQSAVLQLHRKAGFGVL